MRESDFGGSTFNITYLGKVVAYKVNFTDEANLTNAVLVRSVLARSDLGGDIIEDGDFSDTVLDLIQKETRLENLKAGSKSNLSAATEMKLEGDKTGEKGILHI